MLELQTHIGFVESLARTLTRDSWMADDLSQQTLLRALEQPPQRIQSPRPWLREVFLNNLRKTARENSRRRQRELRCVRPLPLPRSVPERAPDTAVADAVLQLREPYRSTIILRFYHDLSFAEIATWQGVPEKTTRTRYARALEKLRFTIEESTRRVDAELAPQGRLHLAG